jgi:hypothetical protein
VGAQPQGARIGGVRLEQVGAAVRQALLGRNRIVLAGQETEHAGAGAHPDGAVRGLAELVQVGGVARAAPAGHRLSAQAREAGAQGAHPQRAVGGLEQGAHVAVDHPGQPVRIEGGHALAVEADQTLGGAEPQVPVARRQHRVHRGGVGHAGPGRVGVLLDARAGLQRGGGARGQGCQQRRRDDRAAARPGRQAGGQGGHERPF